MPKQMNTATFQKNQFLRIHIYNVSSDPNYSNPQGYNIVDNGVTTATWQKLLDWEAKIESS